ncbi:unnamed protein product [Mytilus edulis]|uniref:SOCS box domain-containing protein n=1 Tax=Mytilus edulis TaxID=6550 RepID=A0A8S3PSS9_MYTED|nr:unnamed protein product [Mytilus edulis]
MPNDQLSLLDAIARNDVETVKLFIFGHQICPDFICNGRSPVVVAATNGREEILDILIQSKCDLNLPDFTDETWKKHPIHIAAGKGFLGFVKKLVNNGVNANSLDLEEKTALHWAASFGHVSVIDYLISAGASVNAAQVDGFTPLHCAAALDHDEACKIIIENDAQLNAIDDDGWTPVHHAAAYGHFSVVKTLHEAGASLLLKTPINDNTLHISSYTSTKYKVDILRYLVQCKVPLNDRDGYGNTALHIACTHNLYDNAKCLIELGAELDTCDDYDDSPLLSAACAYDNHNIVSLLIKSGYNCSKEMWIHEERFPLALANDLSLVSTLKYYASFPRTLQELCCYCVLRHMGQQSNSKINSLPIPESLKLQLKDIIK